MYVARGVAGRLSPGLSAAVRTARRLFRAGSSKGFGIQSPWAYRFVRYVIGERCPYYAYEALAALWPDVSGDGRKLCELYLRIANFCQAATAVDFAPSTGAYADYMRAGCRRTTIVDGAVFPWGDKGSASAADDYPLLVRMSAEGDWRRFYDALRQTARRGLMLIVEGIDKSPAAGGLWREIVSDAGCTLTFDLGLCGIVYFDEQRYKQHYTVNL